MAEVRISQIEGTTLPPPPPATVRVASVKAATTPQAQGDIYILLAGVWTPVHIKVRVSGAWV